MMPDPRHRAGSIVPWFDIFMTFLLVSFVFGGLLSSYLVYRSVRTFVAQSQMINLPTLRSQPPDSADPTTPLEPSAPASSQPPGNAAPPPGGATADVTPVPTPRLTEAMNILVVGLDKRDGEEGPFRTDTMIVIHVDPVNKRAAMLSMPRDLLVMIPDYGYGRRLDRINTAHFWGEVYQYPGGGPALAMKTIENNFGIEVNHYIAVDFDGFRQFIDQIDGIDVYVPEPITDHQYPTEDYGYQTIHFDAGQQHLDGRQALIYARTRKSTSDFARAERQQQVILAVRKKVLSLDILPSLTPPNIVRIAKNFGDSVQTDLSVEQIFMLVNTVNVIPDGGIAKAVVDSSMVYDGEGYTLIGRWKLIHETVERLFGTGPIAITAPPTPTPLPATATPVLSETVALTDTNDSEGVGGTVDDLAWIEVRNGTTALGLEEQGALYLQSAGFAVSGIGPAERNDYASSVLVVYADPAPPAVESLARLLNIPVQNIRYSPNARHDIAAQLILGADAAAIVGLTVP